MITEPTVFVLGAGASWAYKFPTGEQLRRDILTSFNGQMTPALAPHDNWLAEKWGIPKLQVRSAVLEFLDKFRDSDESIDLFLVGHHSNAVINRFGRLAIALRILAAESRHAADQRSGATSELKGSWYPHLAWKLREGMRTKDDFIKDFHKNRVTIITFNYDRSLEQYLCLRYLSSFDGIARQDVEDQIKKHIPIIHVHGQVAYLPWQDSGEPKWVYGTSVDTVTAISSGVAENVKIVHDREDYPGRDTVAHAMAQAKHLFFLGFAYDEENLKKLPLSEVGSHISIYGTAYGLREPERRNKIRAIRRYIGHKLDDLFKLGANVTNENPQDCIRLLLRDHLS